MIYNPPTDFNRKYGFLLKIVADDCCYFSIAVHDHIINKTVRIISAVSTEQQRFAQQFFRNPKGVASSK